MIKQETQDFQKIGEQSTGTGQSYISNLVYSLILLTGSVRFGLGENVSQENDL